MATSGTILPEPKWYFVDNYGKPLGSGYMYTYRSLDKTQFKAVYQDVGETLAWTDPIRIDENGTQGPFFWASDELYYIVVTDVNGFQIWDMDGFGPAIAGGGGGGGNVTTYIDLENLVLNNTFWRHAGTDNVPMTTSTLMTLAPGAHNGFSGNIASTNGSPAPDITFIKNNMTATDTITFNTFTLGSNQLTGDVTPQYYLNYACTNNPTGELYKNVQFAICSGAQNLSNQTVTGKIWAQWTSGTPQLTISWRQFYGDGTSASADQITSTTITLISTDNLWHSYPIALPIPSAAGKSLGQCGNDGLFLEIGFPLGVPCNISFTKPAVYLGTLGGLTPTEDFHSNEQIESQANDWRTGDVRSSLNAFAPFGWAIMNDGTIGSLLSLATARADRDTFPLYNLLWNLFNSNQTLAPMYAAGINPAVGPSMAYGVSAIADFSANNQLQLTKTAGRMLGAVGTPSSGNNTGTAWAIGQATGGEQTNQVASHTHTGITTVKGSGTQSGFNEPLMVGANDQGITATTPIALAINAAGVANANIQSPVTYVNMFIKL